MKADPIRITEYQGVHRLSGIGTSYAPYRDHVAIGSHNWLIFGYPDPILRAWHREVPARGVEIVSSDCPCGHVDRLEAQRKEIAALHVAAARHRLECHPEPVTEPDPTEAELAAELHAEFLDRIAAARSRGDVDWLANRLAEKDEAHARTIAKLVSNRAWFRRSQLLVSQLKGQENRANKLAKLLEGDCRTCGSRLDGMCHDCGERPYTDAGLCDECYAARAIGEVGS